MTSAAAWLGAAKRRREQGIWLALLGSSVLHLAGLGGAQLWGPCICCDGKIAPLKQCQTLRPRLNIELVEARHTLQPPPLRRPAEPRRPPTIVAPLKPERPLAAPKRGRIVLPAEALKELTPRPAETTARLPSLPSEHVALQSQADAPVLATPEVFSRADSLVTAEPSEYGLAGTGKATGAGPFGTAPESSGTGQSGGVPAVPTDAAVPETGLPAPPPAKVPPMVAPSSDGPTRPPALLDWTDPPYPERARQEGREGTVVLRVMISTDGKPTRIEIATSSGSSILDLAALSHMRNASFSPALKDGKPAGATISFRVRFRLIKPG